MPTAAELKNAVELGGWEQTAADINAGIEVRERYREALERIAAYDAPDAHAMIEQAKAALR